MTHYEGEALRISEQEQEETDFDWFCLDLDGEVGHFTTAGFKKLPKSVAESKENLSLLAEYFLRAAPGYGGHIVDPELIVALPEPQQRGERYLRSFIAMADKGLYSYDIATYPTSESSYFRVASPSKPLHSSELPLEIREVLGQTVMAVRFREKPRIAYLSTLEA
jgi:hypothetical protein